MIKYKLTTQEMTTYGDFQWKIGEEVKADGKSKELCNEHWLHYYHSPLLAVFLNPTGANFTHPRLWEVDATGKHRNDNGLKGGCTKMTIIKEIPVPEATLVNKIAFGIYCSLEVYKTRQFVKWANKWLLGKNRTAANAAAAAAYAYAYAAAANAAHAAYAANARHIDLISIAEKAMLIK